MQIAFEKGALNDQKRTEIFILLRHYLESIQFRESRRKYICADLANFDSDSLFALKCLNDLT